MDRILEDVSKWTIEQRRAKIEEIYIQRIGAPLNLRSPKRFTEKIQYRKLFENNPVIARCIDKLTCKQYVIEKLGGVEYTIPLIDVWHTPNDVDIKSIPDTCVVKSNCSSDGNNVLLVRNKGELDIENIEKEIKDSWFDRRYLNTNSFFRAYYDVKPCVIVEAFVSDIAKEAREYKFWCFDGEPKLVHSVEDHFVNGENLHDHTVSFFSLEWEYLNVSCGNYKTNPEANKPLYLSEMIEVSKRISKDFSFVRVDFLETNNRIYLTELTFAPFAGLCRFLPDTFDYDLGIMWNYPEKYILEERNK